MTDIVTRGFVGNPKLEFLRVFDPQRCYPAEYYGRMAVLLEDYAYVDRTGTRHTAKAGMVSDGGSIPRFFWRAIEDPFGPSLPAYIIHDWYCDLADQIEDADQKNRMQRFADALFLEMLDVLGIPWMKRRLMFRGVRLGHAVA